ncbi:uncharacterized protein Z519_08221 [Cladophialophora bantiana CBS 173.52]|uniref:Uncharacterized protein n=1 Tax=Cladophialophora bantiana (strain ATCC 10958 / CBS 173.52 / CDC B-1940 / NIH 8579) TaxID=1442370 RepID=A0A0D2HKM1_CLAB1|nr:uncharacterized protein Z519_08221 [Cladophialophora bantiana CBS 173.52]KIW91325.1 hypothetical protein Z519_08221 [Cladophialophora bantiana CBS 173.52]
MSTASSNPHAALQGYLDPTHTSDLHAEWINHPTPWPWVLASVTLSIILGFLGVQASYKSWEPKARRFSDSDTAIPIYPPTDPKSYLPLHQRGLSSASSTTMSSLDERSKYGGLGRCALITSIIGIGWSTIRAGALLAVLTQITMGERGHTYPGIINIVIMFTSVQTYLGSRAMPRILYLLIFVDLCAIYASLILGLLSFIHNKDTSYQEFAVRGGHCPCMLGYKTGHNMKSCATFAQPLPNLVGCDSKYLWANNTVPSSMDAELMPYPKSCLLSSDATGDKDIDPNMMTYMVLAEIIVGGVGLLYGLIVLLFSSRWIWEVLKHPSELLQALTLSKRKGRAQNFGYDNIGVKARSHKMPGRAIGMTVLAFIALLMFAAVTIVVHVLDETQPIRMFYMDSFGLPANTLGDGTATADGGASWSDCFVVDTPVSTDGGFHLWWAVRQSRILRALALA